MSQRQSLYATPGMFRKP